MASGPLVRGAPFFHRANFYFLTEQKRRLHGYIFITCSLLNYCHAVHWTLTSFFPKPPSFSSEILSTSEYIVSIPYRNVIVWNMIPLIIYHSGLHPKILLVSYFSAPSFGILCLQTALSLPKYKDPTAAISSGLSSHSENTSSDVTSPDIF